MGIKKGSIVKRRWKVLGELGSGSFGKVYKGFDLKHHIYVAIKVAPANDNALQNEAECYKKTEQGAEFAGVPYFYGIFRHSREDCLILQLLASESLFDIYVKCGREFSDATVLKLGYELTKRLEVLHSKNILHRDIKPDNIIPGKGIDYYDKLYLIDFSVASHIKKNGFHKPKTAGHEISGNVMFASIRAHEGTTWSRRDDIESVGFVLIYLSRKGIPWRELKTIEAVYQMKRAAGISQLCDGLPESLGKYLRHARNLRFDERPNYSFLKELFVQDLQSKNLINDAEFEWMRMPGFAPPCRT